MPTALLRTAACPLDGSRAAARRSSPGRRFADAERGVLFLCLDRVADAARYIAPLEILIKAYLQHNSSNEAVITFVTPILLAKLLGAALLLASELTAFLLLPRSLFASSSFFFLWRSKNERAVRNQNTVSGLTLALAIRPTGLDNLVERHGCRHRNGMTRREAK